jgi:hypothetical protein
MTANLLALPSSPFAKLSDCGSHAIRTHSTAASSLAGFGIQNSTNSAKRYRDRIRECVVEDDIACRKNLFCVVECPTILRGSSASEAAARASRPQGPAMAGEVLARSDRHPRRERAFQSLSQRLPRLCHVQLRPHYRGHPRSRCVGRGDYQSRYAA